MLLLQRLPHLAELFLLGLGEDPEGHLHDAVGKLDVNPMLTDFDAVRHMEIDPAHSGKLGMDADEVRAILDGIGRFVILFLGL